MSKEMWVIALGALMVVNPYLGVPNSWHTFFAVVGGAIILLLGFVLRGESVSHEGHAKESRGHHFVENSSASSMKTHQLQHSEDTSNN